MVSSSSKRSWRRRLSLRALWLVLFVLGALAACGAAFTLDLVMTSWETTFRTRTAEHVRAELALLASAPDLAEAPNTPQGVYFGMRRGSVEAGGSGARLDPSPPVVEQALAAAIDRARSAPGPSIVERDMDVVAGALGRSDGRIVWVVSDMPYPPAMRGAPIAAAFVSALVSTVVLIAALVVWLVRRGCASLVRSLQRVAEDLDAPVERPALSEIGRVADGIADMATSLRAGREAHRELMRRLDERERLAALGRVSAGVAHELRNPLAAIKLRVDLAARDDALPADTREEMRELSREVVRMDALVSDLLSIAGRRLGARRLIEIAPLVRGRAALLDPWAQGRGVALQVSGSAVATVDPDAVARAVDNVLRNAIEASAPGSAVRVTVSGSGRTVSIAVEDEGAGVPEDQRSRLFEPFFTTKPHGTGLGLALSRSIAEAHGGSLAYHREAGTTRFELVVPAVEADHDQDRADRRR